MTDKELTDKLEEILEESKDWVDYYDQDSVYKIDTDLAVKLLKDFIIEKLNVQIT